MKSTPSPLVNLALALSLYRTAFALELCGSTRMNSKQSPKHLFYLSVKLMISFGFGCLTISLHCSIPSHKETKTAMKKNGLYKIRKKDNPYSIIPAKSKIEVVQDDSYGEDPFHVALPIQMASGAGYFKPIDLNFHTVEAGTAEINKKLSKPPKTSWTPTSAQYTSVSEHEKVVSEACIFDSIQTEMSIASLAAINKSLCSSIASIDKSKVTKQVSGDPLPAQSIFVSDQEKLTNEACTLESIQPEISSPSLAAINNICVTKRMPANSIRSSQNVGHKDLTMKEIMGGQQDINSPFESKFKPSEMLCLALVAHNEMKQAMKNFIESHSEILKKFRLTGTRSTMTVVKNFLGDDPSMHYGPTLASGPLGGDSQIATLMVEEKLGGIIFFVDPLTSHAHCSDIDALTRMAIVHNVMLCHNPTSAESAMWTLRNAVMSGKVNMIPSFFKKLESPCVEAYNQRQKKVVEDLTEVTEDLTEFDDDITHEAEEIRCLEHKKKEVLP